MDALIVSHANLLDLAGIQPVRELRRSHRVIKRAHKSKDESVALRAADLNLKLIDAYPKADQPSEPGRPIAVVINLAQPAHVGTELQSHGIRLHLSGHNGDAS